MTTRDGLVSNGLNSPPLSQPSANLIQLKAMSNLVDGVDDNDRLVFFFSGHAAQMYGPLGESSGDGFTEGMVLFKITDGIHKM